MIKSINYRANQIASIEISDASDVQSLGDSYGYGSTARVTGQIGDEYIYTPQGWIKISSGGVGGEPFIITLTPTALDFSGTMDKTSEEITAAYKAGKRIRFFVPSMDSALFDATQYAETYDDGTGELTFVAVEGNVLYVDNHALVAVITQPSLNDDDLPYYNTTVYALTPAT